VSSTFTVIDSVVSSIPKPIGVAVIAHFVVSSHYEFFRAFRFTVSDINIRIFDRTKHCRCRGDSETVPGVGYEEVSVVKMVVMDFHPFDFVSCV
jgi:hypothetical protein